MIRVAFVIGGYPPEEHKRRADVASVVLDARNSSRDCRRGGQPYFYGMTPRKSSWWHRHL